MIRTSHAAAADRDIKAMTRGKGSLGRNLLFVSLPTALVLGAIVYAVWRSAVAASLIGAAAFVSSAWSNLSFFRGVRRRTEAATDAQGVTVTEVQASRVLDIEPLGSHGPAYVFFGADGKALLLVGQWLLEARRFPSDAFRLYQWADTKQPIRIEASGRRVKPEPSAVQLRAGYRLSDVEIFDATPETLQQDLDRAFARA